MDAQRRGSRTRQKAGTALNYSSSRSHAVFTIALYGTYAAREQHREVPTHLSVSTACVCPLKCEQQDPCCEMHLSVQFELLLAVYFRPKLNLGGVHYMRCDSCCMAFHCRGRTCEGSCRSSTSPAVRGQAARATWGRVSSAHSVLPTCSLPSEQLQTAWVCVDETTSTTSALLQFDASRKVLVAPMTDVMCV